MGELRVHGDDGGLGPCFVCRAPAVGPCARCRRLVCGDCCSLSEGTLRSFALCVVCARGEGASLRQGWRQLAWLLVPVLVVLAAVVILLLRR